MDGQRVTLGDTTITVHKTPGHTPGTLSFLIPVTIDGKQHVAAFWGGTALWAQADVKLFNESARRFAEHARRTGADIMLSNHDVYGDYFRKITEMKANPRAPNPFVIGIDGVQRFLQVLEHCAAAHLAVRESQGASR